MRTLVVGALLLFSAGCEQPVAPVDSFPVEVLPANITGAELRDRLGTVVVVDVRSPAEFEAGHIPGAWNVPVEEVSRRTDEIRAGAFTQPIVVYCKAGRRAAVAIAALRDAGIRASHLDGDFDAWATAGMPVEKSAPKPEPTQREREGWD